MNWSESISRAIEYIGNNLTNDITIEEISKYSYISSFYFQKGFSMLCGYSISEYIRNRRLSKAAYELIHTDNKIIDMCFFPDILIKNNCNQNYKKDRKKHSEPIRVHISLLMHQNKLYYTCQYSTSNKYN